MQTLKAANYKQQRKTMGFVPRKNLKAMAAPNQSSVIHDNSAMMN